MMEGMLNFKYNTETTNVGVNVMSFSSEIGINLDDAHYVFMFYLPKYVILQVDSKMKISPLRL